MSWLLQTFKSVFGEEKDENSGHQSVVDSGINKSSVQESLEKPHQVYKAPKIFSASPPPPPPPSSSRRLDSPSTSNKTKYKDSSSNDAISEASKDFINNFSHPSVHHMNSVDSSINNNKCLVQGSLEKPHQVYKAPKTFSALFPPSYSKQQLDPPNATNKTKYALDSASSYAIPEGSKDSINNLHPSVHHMNSGDSGNNYKSLVQGSLQKSHHVYKAPKTFSTSPPPSSFKRLDPQNATNKTKYTLIPKQNSASNCAIPEGKESLQNPHTSGSGHQTHSVDSGINHKSLVQGAVEKPHQVYKVPKSFASSPPPSSSKPLDPPNTSNKTKYTVVHKDSSSNYSIPECSKELSNNPHSSVHHMNSVDSSINKSLIQGSLEKPHQVYEVPKTFSASPSPSSSKQLDPPDSSNKTKYAIVHKDSASISNAVPEVSKESINHLNPPVHMNSEDSVINKKCSYHGSLEKPHGVYKAPKTFSASPPPSSFNKRLDLHSASNKKKYPVVQKDLVSNYGTPKDRKESMENPHTSCHHMDTLDSGINLKSSVEESLEKHYQVYKAPKSFASSPPPYSSKRLDPPNTSSKNVVQKHIASHYVIPVGIIELIKKNIVPEVLKKPLSPSTYRDFFAALLYAEDFYIEKWSNFCFSNVNLEVHRAAIYKKSNNDKNLIESNESDDKMIVAFQIDLIPENRPYLLSGDFVFVQPSGMEVEPFQGILCSVVKSKLVLAEFGDDFHCQHSPNCKYDISFSFKKVPLNLKRCHQAVSVAAINPLFHNFLFPDQISRISIPTLGTLSQDQISAIWQISRVTGPPPYLIEGDLCLTSSKQLSRTGFVILEAVLQIYRTSPDCRVLINAPTNDTCDVLLRSLKKEIPESDMFKANAAFRELDGVPYDILPSCVHKGEYFTCPSLEELRSFKVILSTFVSSFRLLNEGICAGHFSHIFLVDASSATEPEIMVALTNLVDNKTCVVVTGALGNCSGWVRSGIARDNGLKISYFQRLLESKPDKSMYVKHVGDNGPN